MKTTLKLLMLPLLAVLMAACSDDDKPTSPTLPSNSLWDIVTVEKITKTSTTFTVRKDADLPLATLVASYSFEGSKDVKEGQRIMIIYTSDGHPAYTSGGITLYGYRLLEQTQAKVLEGTSTEYSNWQSDPLDMISLWRTGDYINIHANAFCHNASRPKRFILVADKATLGKETVQLHVIYEEASHGENRQVVYASIDMEDVWDLPTCKAVEINYFSASGNMKKTFTKSNYTPTPNPDPEL